MCGDPSSQAIAMERHMTHSPLLSTLAFLATLSACSDNGDALGPAGPAGTSPATQLATVSPNGQSTGVDRNGPVTLRFDGAMMPGMQQYVDLHRGDITGPIHPIVCAWSADATLLTCTPTTPLDPATGYTVHVGGGMRNSNGDPVRMEPAEHMGSWIYAGTSGGMMGGGMEHTADHAGGSWGMLDPGWRHANGSYGIVCPFQTGG
jgi:hypothetical protein